MKSSCDDPHDVSFFNKNMFLWLFLSLQGGQALVNVLVKCSSAEIDAHHANLIKWNEETNTDLNALQLCQGHSHILALRFWPLDEVSRKTEVYYFNTFD